MALDTIQLDAIEAADDVATDLVGGRHYEVVKHAFGASGTANLVTSVGTNPLPVTTPSYAAHDAAISGATVATVVGARATASVEGETEVAVTDATHLNATISGNLITSNLVAPEEIIAYHVVNTAGTELAVTGLDAGGATIYNYITSITVHNAHASTMGFIQLLDGTGGTPFLTLSAPATSGNTITFNPPLKQPTVNKATFWDASAAITTLYVTIVGYQGQG